MESDTPNKIVDLLLNKGVTSESNKENIDEVNQEVYNVNQAEVLTDFANESYDDEPIKLCNNKTGEDYNKLRDRTLNTIRSTSSLSNLPNGKIPIETNRVELVWGCVKVGKSQSQEFILRNRSHCRIRFLASITGSSFKIIKDSENCSNLKLMLRPMETRTVSVLFSPVSQGSAVEKIIFTPIDNHFEQTSTQLIKLYGYGGHIKIDLLNLVKDTTGKFLLSFGKIDDKKVYDGHFIVHNNGTLPAFVLLHVEYKRLYLSPNVIVQPTQFVLNAQEEREIKVIYMPKKEDFHYIQEKSTSVLEIACIKAITGAEVTRGRIRRLCKKAETKRFDIHPLHKQLSEIFDKELMPVDLGYFKETITSMKELSQEFRIKEIIVTAEEDPDCTFLVDTDTTMFQTLCNDNSNNTVLENIVLENENRIVTVEPAILILQLPIKVTDTFLLSSESDHPLKFNIDVLPEKGLEVNPKTGMISVGKTVIVRVTCSNKHVEEQTYNIRINTENEVAEVIVKIAKIRV